MAIRSVATTDTLETFRTTFNSLAGTDIGDNTSLSTTERGSIVGAINEINTSLENMYPQVSGATFNADGSNTYNIYF